MKQPSIVIYNVRERMALHIVRNIVTLMVITLCAYVSKDSTWWTFVSGLFFILFIAAKAKAMLDNTTTKIYTKAEAQAWANSLPEDVK